MDLLAKIFDAGVVGAGGAGFPAHKKMVSGVEWLLINGAECEPLLASDVYMMEENTEKLIATLDLLKEEMGFEHVVIGIKAKHGALVEKLQSVIDEKNSTVTLHLLKNVYPMGDEQVLVFEIMGKVVPPGGIPLQIGAVVQNPTTILAIADALNGQAMVEKVVTVTGEVNRPCLLNVPVGTTIAECIQAAGGSPLADYICMLGGPMMGRKITKTEAETTVITKTDNGIIVLATTHVLPTFQRISSQTIYNRARAACIQCSLCTDLCPRFLLGHQIRPHRVMRSVATGEDPLELADALLCCECGICELYACPMGLSPREMNVFFKVKLRAAGIKSGDPHIYEQYQQTRAYRQIPQERLIHRLQLAPYEHKHLTCFSFTPGKVSIPLKQGIGRPAEACVSVGQFVQKGDCIGSLPIEEMGAKVHASIGGKVTSVSPTIVITSQNEGGDHQ